MKLKILSAFLLLTSLNACSDYSQIDDDQRVRTDQELFEKAKHDFDQQDYGQSHKSLKILAEKNNKEAMYALGYQYYYGLGVKKNSDAAQDYIRRSADLGYKPAIKALRQFNIANSTFVVDTKSSSYLAANNNAEIDNNKILAVNEIESNDTNLAIDQLLENADAAKNKNNSETVKLADITPNNAAHGFGSDSLEKPKNSQETAIETASTEQQPEVVMSPKTVKTAKLAKTKDKTKTTKIAAKSKPKASPDIWDSAIKVSANDAKIINRIAEAAKIKQTNDLLDEDKISIVNTENQFKDTTEPESIEPIQAIQSISADNSTEPSVSLSKNLNWLQSQDPKDYTIQISASNNQAEIDQFIKNNNLQNKVRSFSYLYNNQTWYGAGYGVYTKPSDAYQALLEELPAELKIKKPWVRQFKNIVPANVG